MSKQEKQNKEEKQSIEDNCKQVAFPACSGQELHVLARTPEFRWAVLGMGSKEQLPNHLQRLTWSISKQQQESAEDGYSGQGSLKHLKPLLG